MKTNLLKIAPVVAITCALSVANAQDNNRDGLNRDSNQSYQENENTSQGRTQCEICGLTVEKANGETKGLKVVDIQRNSPGAHSNKAGSETP